MNQILFLVIKFFFGISLGLIFSILNYVKQQSMNRINIINQDLIEENFLLSFCLGFVSGLSIISFLFN